MNTFSRFKPGASNQWWTTLAWRPGWQYDVGSAYSVPANDCRAQCGRLWKRKECHVSVTVRLLVWPRGKWQCTGKQMWIPPFPSPPLKRARAFQIFQNLQYFKTFKRFLLVVFQKVQSLLFSKFCFENCKPWNLKNPMRSLGLFWSGPDVPVIQTNNILRREIRWFKASSYFGSGPFVLPRENSRGVNWCIFAMLDILFQLPTKLSAHFRFFVFFLSLTAIGCWGLVWKHLRSGDTSGTLTQFPDFESSGDTSGTLTQFPDFETIETVENFKMIFCENLLLNIGFLNLSERIFKSFEFSNCLYCQ